MRRKSLLFVLVILTIISMGLVGCKQATVGIPAVEKVSIANKVALQAEWFEGSSDRQVEIALSPNGVTTDNTKFSIVSNRPSVISVGDDGKTLKAVGAGTATITAVADDKSDSVIITVKPLLREIAIINKSELSSLWVLNDGERLVDVALKPDIFDDTNTSIEIKSSNTDIISVDGMKLNAIAVGASTVTVTIGEFSDSVDMEVIKLSDPVLKLTGDTEIKGVVNSDIILPVEALSCDGKDLSDYTTIACEYENLTYNKANRSVKVTQKGDYTIKLSVTDPRDAGKTDEQTFSLKVFRKVFNAVDGYGMGDMEAVFDTGKEFVEDGEQSVYFNRHDATFAQFDMTPSKVYYAEVTLTADADNDSNALFGMSHSVKDDTTRWLTSFIDRGDADNARNLKVKFSDMVEDNEWWNLDERSSRVPLYWSYRIHNYRGLNDGGNGFPVKLAVARVGEYFYTFVNDDYVNTVVNRQFENVDTVAGIYQQSHIRASYTQINWMTDETAVRNKIKSLTEKQNGIISAYVPESWALNSQNTDNRNFTVGTVDQTDGLNYAFINANTAWNDGMISPYLYFDGDFTFEWVFEFDKDLLSSDPKDLMRMWLDVRGYDYTDECVRFGASYGHSGKDPAHLFAETVSGGAYNDFFGYNDINGADWNGTHADSVNKFKFTISRKCMGDKARFVMKWTAIDQDGSEGRTEQFVWDWDGYNGNGQYMWDPCKPVILLWHHVGITGKCTNIKWSSTVTESKETSK